MRWNLLLLTTWLAACGSDVAERTPRTPFLEAELDREVQADREREDDGDDAALTLVAGPGVKYPIVLAHGLFASANLFSFQPVARHLRSLGHVAFVTEVPAVASVAVRARALATQVDAVLARTGAGRVNLIAHSMGGLDARYLISTLGYGDRVASLTTIATPHRGSPVADEALQSPDGIPVAIDIAVRLATSLYNDASDFSTADLRAALRDLSVAYVTRVFNPKNVDDPRVSYRSWAGAATPDGDPALMRVLLRGGYDAIRPREGANDGLVSVTSAKWGRYRGVVAADHMGEIGVGRTLLRNRSAYRHLTFFADVARELVAAGR